METADQALLYALAVLVIKVGCAQLSIWLTPGEDVVDDDEDGMPQRHERTFLAPPCGDAPVLGRQVGGFGFGRNMRDFD